MGRGLGGPLKKLQLTLDEVADGGCGGVAVLVLKLLFLIWLLHILFQIWLIFRRLFRLYPHIAVLPDPLAATHPYSLTDPPTSSCSSLSLVFPGSLLPMSSPTCVEVLSPPSRCFPLGLGISSTCFSPSFSSRVWLPCGVCCSKVLLQYFRFSVLCV